MITRETFADILEVVGDKALFYYDTLPLDVPTYRLAEEVDECLADVDGIDDDDRRILETLIAATIIDPTSHRRELTAYLLGLLPDEAEADDAA